MMPLVMSGCATTLASQQPERSAQRRDEEGLGEHERQHEAVGEADRLQHRELARALADRDRHGVAGDEQQREEDDGADGHDQELDVAHLLHERRRERLSVWVRVSDAEFANSASIALWTSTAWSGLATRTTYQPTIPASTRGALLVEVAGAASTAGVSSSWRPVPR